MNTIRKNPMRSHLSRSGAAIPCLIAIALLIASVFATTPSLAGRVVFEMVDPKDDDKGPGYYEYPLDPVFNDGAFDLRRFRVIDEGRYVELVFTFEGEIRRNWQSGNDLWTEDNNWILQTMDVYIDTDGVAGSGNVRAVPGRNVTFRIDAAWEKVILVSPKGRERIVKKIKNMSEDLEFSSMHTAVIVPTFTRIKRYDIVARVDKRELGEPQPWWGWQVLVLGNDSRETSNSFYNRDVVSFKTNDKFGGGSDYNGDPNVIDMLADSPSQQKDWLGGYRSVPDPKNCRFAVIGSNYKEKRPAAKAFEMPRKDYDKVLENLMTRAVSGSSGRNKKENTVMTVPREADEPGLETGTASVSYDNSETGTNSCRTRMTSILEAAVDYHAKHPEDGNITLLDLIYEGYFTDKVSCPGGGKYAIYGEEEDKIKVRCFNPSGVEHGSIP